MLLRTALKPVQWVVSLLFAFCFITAAYAADPLSGKKQIFLIDSKGQSVVAGSITFVPEGESSRYELHMDHSKFQDYFLSMKEMKCLEGPELWCHLPYPYQQPHLVSRDDLSWLSHDLLFMFKKKKDFGANFWNGIYYQMQLTEGVIRGEAQAVDLNLLASPPDDLTVPPMGEGERDELDPTKRWLPTIEIR